MGSVSCCQGQGDAALPGWHNDGELAARDQRGDSVQVHASRLNLWANQKRASRHGTHLVPFSRAAGGVVVSSGCAMNQYRSILLLIICLLPLLGATGDDQKSGLSQDHLEREDAGANAGTEQGHSQPGAQAPSPDAISEGTPARGSLQPSAIARRQSSLPRLAARRVHHVAGALVGDIQYIVVAEVILLIMGLLATYLPLAPLDVERVRIVFLESSQYLLPLRLLFLLRTIISAIFEPLP